LGYGEGDLVREDDTRFDGGAKILVEGSLQISNTVTIIFVKTAP